MNFKLTMKMKQDVIDENEQKGQGFQNYQIPGT